MKMPKNIMWGFAGMVLGVAMLPLPVLAQESRGAESASILSRVQSIELSGTLVFGVLIIMTVLWYLNKEKLTIQKLGIPLLLLWILLIGGTMTSPTTYEVSTKLEEDWQLSYQNSLANYNIPKSYLSDTEYYNFDSEEVERASDIVLSGSINAENAVQRTLNYIFDNVEYNISESDEVCFDKSADEIIKDGHGQCDTQSISVISILRKIGIAARPVGGCLSRIPGCDFKFALLQAAGRDVRQPKYTELVSVEPNMNYSRAAFSRKGGLHAWVEVWLPNKGWVTIEPTAGTFADLNCFDYEVELYPEKKFDICVSKDYDFAKRCAEK